MEDLPDTSPVTKRHVGLHPFYNRVSMTQLCFPLPVCSIARQICTDLWRHNGEQDTPAPAPSPPWPASLHAEGTLEARTTHPCRPAKAACEKRRDSLGFTAGGGTVMKRKLFNIISLSLWVSILKTRPRAALGEMKPGILNNQSQETVSHLDTTGGVSWSNRRDLKRLSTSLEQDGSSTTAKGQRMQFNPGPQFLTPRCPPLPGI